jgi:hypothetical protein
VQTKKNQKEKWQKRQGISINKNSLAKPKSLRKIIKFGEDGSTRIMSADGKTVKYEGRNQSQSTKTH